MIPDVKRMFILLIAITNDHIVARPRRFNTSTSPPSPIWVSVHIISMINQWSIPLPPALTIHQQLLLCCCHLPSSFLIHPRMVRWRMRPAQTGHDNVEKLIKEWSPVTGADTLDCVSVAKARPSPGAWADNIALWCSWLIGRYFCTDIPGASNIAYFLIHLANQLLFESRNFSPNEKFQQSKLTK